MLTKMAGEKSMKIDELEGQRTRDLKYDTSLREEVKMLKEERTRLLRSGTRNQQQANGLVEEKVREKN